MNAPVESVPVIQADREAAASHLEGWRWYESVGPRVVNEIRQGKRDDSETVQNFARHRINQVAELVAGIEEVLCYRRGEGNYNFSGLSDYDRSNALFDAWQEIEGRLSALIASHKGEQP